MKKTLLTVFVILSQLLTAQNVGDTIRIQTIHYNTDTRDTIINFTPLNGFTFEKVLMKYSIRCHDGLVSTVTNRDLGCGEWDYSCNTYLHDPSKIDSVLFKHDNYTVSNFSGSSFSYVTQPLYDFYQFNQQNVQVNNINSETQFVLNNGALSVSQVVDGSKKSGKSQFLFTASELTNAGFTAGDINGIVLNTLNNGNINFLKVNVKHTNATALNPTTPETSGFTNVFFSNYNFVAGNNRIQFHTPFTWNGTDNLIFEFSFTNSTPTNDIQFSGENTSNAGIYANDNYHVDLTGQSIIDVTTSNMSNISDELTVSFWAKGNTGVSTENTTIIHGINANGKRSLNVHFPWSNSKIYFDCGWEGTGYDRIFKPAGTSLLENHWNHWAFVKNTNDGTMIIYLNGQPWHNGNQKHKLIEIVEMVIGGTNISSFPYKGRIDELRIWNKALSQSDIQNWKNISIDATHPQYAHLLAYYKMDDGSGNLLQEEIGSTTTTCSPYNWKFIRGDKILRFFKPVNTRPNITLLQGNYDLTVTNNPVLDSIQRTPNIVTYWTIVSHPNTLQHDEVVPTSQLTTWEAVPENVYDESGTVINTIPVTPEATLPPPVKLDYYKRYPSKFEIMSFVTPYGIGLDLGQEGKTWTFDVTDYLPLFTGTKRMTIEMGAWQEDMDIDFLFIVGTPPREVLDITQIWRPVSRTYQDIINDRYFAPKDLTLDPNGESFKLRTVITGHGQQGEFIQRTHFINLNGGSPEFTWQVWKECADNPVYPQGGTWVYDRAGWCPGAPSNFYFNDITPYVNGNTVNIDYGVAYATGDSRYIVNNQLVTYGAINHNLDVSVVEVKEPSNRIEYNRFNPICRDPKVLIKNTGATTLTSCKIDYWTNNAAQPYTYTWNGNLAYGETELVVLPVDHAFWNNVTPTGNEFHVSIYEPNSGTDEYTYNNFYHSKFNAADVVPADFILYVKTNNAAYENSYQITDEQGNVILSRSNLSPNTVYQDTLHLSDGCFNFYMSDSGDDGIAWWANNDGYGSAKFLNETGTSILKIFEPDFGDNINYNFSVLYPSANEELSNNELLNLYPNPAHNQFVIEGDDFNNVSVKIYTITGQSINIPYQINDKAIEFNTKSIPVGIYFIQLNNNGVVSNFKVILK